MAGAVKPIPDGFHTTTPYLIVKGAAKAIAYYKEAFGATELFRFDGPNGTIGHAELRIGDSPFMLSDECPQMGALSPETVGGSPVGFCLYVENADAVFAQALAAGATVKKPMADQFYGDRSGTVTDPFGHVWTVATHIEDVPLEEMKKRCEALYGAK
jgi:PhnB protein